VKDNPKHPKTRESGNGPASNRPRRWQAVLGVGIFLVVAIGILASMAWRLIYPSGAGYRPVYSNGHMAPGASLPMMVPSTTNTAVTEYDAKSLNNFGAALRQQGKLDEAIRQYREAIKIDPAYAPAHYNLANALAQKGQVNEAIGEYQAALKLRPDNERVQRNIAHMIWVLATSPEATARNGTKAVEFASEANQTTSSPNPLILRVLAAAYAESGNFAKATETAKQALGLAEEKYNFPLETALQKDISGYLTNSPVRAEPQDMTGWQ
jgi:tetratricopeptide (TPR) repeat protein